MPSSPEQLRRLEEHLDHVSVAVPGRGLARIHAEKEDVHPAWPRLRLARSSSFQPLPLEMASNLRRTDDLHRLKAREIWLQDVSGTYAPDGSILYVRGDGLVKTHSGVYVPVPGDLVVPGTLTVGTVIAMDVSADTVSANTVIAGDVIAGDVSAASISTNSITLTGPCASIAGTPTAELYSRLWMKQQPAFNTPSLEASNLLLDDAITLSRNMKSIACDSQSNIYVTYTTTGTIAGQTSSGATDIVIAKFGPAGDLLWVVQPTAINAEPGNPFAEPNNMWPTITIGPADEVFVGMNRAVLLPTITAEVVRVYRIDPTNGTVLWSSDPLYFLYGGFVATGTNVWCITSTTSAIPGPTITKLDSSTGATVTPYFLNRDIYEVDIAKSSSRIYFLQHEFSSGGAYPPNVTNLHIDYMDIATEQFTVGTTDASFNPASWGTQSLTGMSIKVGPDDNPVFIYFTTSNAPGTTYSGSGVDIVVVKVDGTTLAPIWIRQFSTGWKDTSVLGVGYSSIGSSLAIDDAGRIFILYTTNYGSDIDVKVKTFDAAGTELATFLPPFANTLLPDYVPSITTVPGSRDFAIAYHTDGRVSGGVDSGGGDLVVARFTPIETSVTLQPGGGYVGIGTCSPGKPLDVRGTAAASTLFATGGDPAGSGGYKYITNSGTYMTWNPAFENGLSSLNNERGLGTGGFEFTIHDHADPSTYITPMTILHNSTGDLSGVNVRVGINTTTPEVTLDVIGDIHGYNLFAAGPQVGGYGYIQDQGSYMSWNNSIPTGSGYTSFNCQRGGGYGGFIFTIHDSSSNYIQPLTILHTTKLSQGSLTPANIRVGINNTNPQYTLDVSGVVAAHDSNGVFGLFSSGTATMPQFDISAGPIPVPGLTTSGRILATFQGNPYNATKLWAELGTDQFKLHVDQNPADGPVDISWLVLKL